MIIVGIDEVGRGCWAGPLVAGAVVLNVPIKGIKDSKLLSRTTRQKLSAQILEQATATGLGWVTNIEIDNIGLTRAVSLAMARALKHITAPYEQIIIDGNYNFLSNNPFVVTKVKADGSVLSVSAASIIAKVARDNYMAAAAKRYPDYGFDSHVGYGTQNHHMLLKLYGPCALHRKSYKPIMELML